MRYVVVGTAGSGKSTVASAMAVAMQCPYVELDSLYWGPNWQAVSSVRFEHAVRAAMDAERWVVDGNYSALRDMLWARATHVVWLNFGRATTLSRVLFRTVQRAVKGTELYNGNRESLRMAFFSRRSILLDAYNSFPKNRRRFARLRRDDRFGHLHWIEITQPSGTTDFVESLRRPEP